MRQLVTLLHLHGIYLNAFAFSHDVKKSVYHAGGSRICFLTGLEPAESLQGGLCLLASAQVLSGRITGALVARPLQHARTHAKKQAQGDAHDHANYNGTFGSVCEYSRCNSRL